MWHRLWADRRTRVVLIVLGVLLALAGLRMLAPIAPDQADDTTGTPTAVARPTDPPTDPPTGRPTGRPTDATSPSRRVPGPLPSPTVDQANGRLTGDLPVVGAEPGQGTILSSVRLVLEHFCPGFGTIAISVEQIDGFKVVEASTLVRGKPVTLLLRWTGRSYRWQGSIAELEACAR